MNSPIFGLRVASAAFGLMTLAQAARLVIRPHILVNGYEMPLWPSLIAAIVLGGLCLWMWGLARNLAK